MKAQGFGFEDEAPQKKQEPAKTPRGWCSCRCKCGATIGAHLGHYDLLKCECGAVYWALQPKRGGPLKLFEHPETDLPLHGPAGAYSAV